MIFRFLQSISVNQNLFPATNQIAIVYANEYEKLMTSFCKDFEKNENIDQVLCYSNTINEKLAYNELNDKFEELGQDTKIDEYLLINHKYFVNYIFRHNYKVFFSFYLFD